MGLEPTIKLINCHIICHYRHYPLQCPVPNRLSRSPLRGNSFGRMLPKPFAWQHGGLLNEARPVSGTTIAPGDSRLAERLKHEIRGEVLFSRADRGRYATDASIYQVEPLELLPAMPPIVQRACVDGSTGKNRSCSRNAAFR